ncbi:hypothetical protein Xvie_02849 [Xenorhabdus vietnamensis]|uniref:Uncharacterized protein n=1 Tax=Xenorhabdus vietnamensis TaxID=351656 RepID=A0A1Y2SCU3_9GAMM|nr:hypothetical protein Xvie_02849 [Xenorhabdus vietnamensis]
MKDISELASYETASHEIIVLELMAGSARHLRSNTSFQYIPSAK